MERRKRYLTAVILWMIAFSLFGFLRFYGLADLPAIDVSVKQFYFPWPVFLLLGAITGVVYETIENRLRSRHLLMRRPYWMILAIKPPIYGLLALGLMLLGSISFNRIFYAGLPWHSIWEVVTGKVFWVFFVFFLVASFGISFFQIITQYFGGRVLTNLLLGKYYRPFEEYRIFMFLDMRDSTSIAEQLGTMQYSKFVQDAFRDFTPIIEQYHPEIHQYVGDEMVITWMPKPGLKNFNCIRTCYAYNALLRSKRKYYESEYGIVPRFKAGIHIGWVRVVEVGVHRRAIAYHGDVMNTTARIQSMCKVLGYEVLISEALWKELPEPDGSLAFEPLAEVILKGKASPVKLVGVREIQQADQRE
ncbi:MAG: adenylate/guanylate cyclase domain-containing protein [Bacteroidetes bacterium]|nr:MAG: adenylate/guanylate cyclase domain-containing protein [Bacteroidota bacterium]